MRKNYDLEVLNYELRASTVSPRTAEPADKGNEKPRVPRQGISDFDVLNYELLALARARSPKVPKVQNDQIENESGDSAFASCKESDSCSISVCCSSVRTRCTKLSEQRSPSLCDITNQKPIVAEDIDHNPGSLCGDLLKKSRTL